MAKGIMNKMQFTKEQIEALQDYKDDLIEMKKDMNRIAKYSPILEKYGKEINELIKEHRKNNLPIDSVVIRVDIYDAMRAKIKKTTGHVLLSRDELKKTKRGYGSVFGYNIELNHDLSADKFKIIVC